MYQSDTPAWRFADRNFDGIVGTQGCSAVPVAVVEKDVQELKNITRPVKQLSDQVIVHTDLKRSKLLIPTYGQLDRAIDFLRDIFAKYHLLVSARMYSPVPLDDYDVTRALTRLWQA
jgi:hypothetical protein